MTVAMASRAVQADAAHRQRTVLFVVNAAWFFLSHRLPLARAARENGYDVHVLTDVSTPGEAEALSREGLTVHHARIARGSINPFGDLRFILRAMRVMRLVAPALVHNVTVKPVLYGTLAARLVGAPCIVNAISGFGYAFSHESRWLLATVLRTAYGLVLRSPRVRVIFQNDDDAHEFQGAGLVSAEQSVLIRGSGVDLARFSPGPEDPAAPPLVVLAARMLRDKGVGEFVAAARLLRERGCAARMVLAGPLDESNPAALTRAELETLTSAAHVQWLGQVDEMPELYRRAHIVCLPSYREGLPKSLIEACAAAKPIVTTDVPGCRAVVADRVNGLLVPARDALALADALEMLINDAPLRARFGAAGRVRAEREFAIGSVVRQTMELYARALAANR